MHGHNTWSGAILALLIIIFSFWETSFSKWLIIVIAAIWLIHALFCNECKGSKKAKPKKKK